ncbi:MAG: glycine cleavage system aminomethyltransferase GcvT [Gammaproteobacteria bacterium]
MSNAAPTARRTPLFSWHAAHGARMVEFEGWTMPLNYQNGILQEHLATRRRAGLFDVSHMGRFKIEGEAAEDFALTVLTNNARALGLFQAQYTFLANEQGGAIDDAYLYKLARGEFLLVVNASNRDKDWLWLQSHKCAGAELSDVSAELAMVAVQGPASAAILESVVGREALPESKRNCCRAARVEGQTLLIARTGYTGETLGFELFPKSEYLSVLWERLVSSGAIPAGLGARDTLRIEAGLPLYGHELGRDHDGNDIPIFANTFASFAVRVPDRHDYIGQARLDDQRKELQLIKRGELHTPLEDRMLKRLVRPIMNRTDKRPFRAGSKVFRGDEMLGYVSSGTVAPYSRTSDGEENAMEAEVPRPIGLALIDSTLGYQCDPSLVLRVVDDRGRGMAAECVTSNLVGAAPKLPLG